MLASYRYRATCARVVDGDTYHLTISLGFHCSITVPVRLRDVNAPELNTPEGKAARAWAVMLLTPEGCPPIPLVVESHRDKQTFARWVCDCWTEAGSLADLLVDAGHAVRV